MNSEVDQKRFAESTAQTRGEIERRLAEIAGERLAEIVGEREGGGRQRPGPDDVREAIRYTLLDGGKRLRPLLCVWTHDGLGGGNRDACLDAACAVECLHTYSLVHDDLPCMDDDDMRRGKPSCHKKFGVAVAVLTGDALLTLCFEIIASLGARWQLDDGLIVETSRVVARAAGMGGLITGQALDLRSGELEADLDTVEIIHRHKTAALIAAAMETGAVLAGADSHTRERVHRAGTMAGEAFQIIDDVLDLQMDGKTLGKTPGKDTRTGKLTYPSVAGVDASRRRAGALIDAAKSQLGPAAGRSALGTLLDYIVSRSR